MLGFVIEKQPQLVGFQVPGQWQFIPANFCFTKRDDAIRFAEESGLDKRDIMTIREGHMNNPKIGTYADAQKYTIEATMDTECAGQSFSPSIG